LRAVWHSNIISRGILTFRKIDINYYFSNKNRKIIIITKQAKEQNRKKGRVRTEPNRVDGDASNRGITDKMLVGEVLGE
jgi:hypothetical protein